MPTSDETDAYRSYLLRLWRARCQGEWQWRASIESRRTGEHQAFGSLEELFAFLSERCADASEPRITASETGSQPRERRSSDQTVPDKPVCVS